MQMCLYSSKVKSSSWETIFSKSSEVVSPQELQCCRRLVQLCRDCLLVVYKFVSESRGSLMGLSPEWDDTSFPFAAGPTSTHGSPPAAVAAASSTSSSSVSSPLSSGLYLVQYPLHPVPMPLLTAFCWCHLFTIAMKA
ncbi:hypothetical protein ILYODFUR_018089 [Ilyodon furcidens]|uniref:Uncharacterized protein n=1 Tax=Ilyodon furcidens TaxID=33524 RepID=A0ABV0VF02_9TELE